MDELTLRLSEYTLFDAVRDWPAPDGSPITFVITRASSFEPGTEGLALSYLSSCIAAGASLTLRCEFAPPSNAKEFVSTLLSSVFGFALIRASKDIRFARGVDDATGQLRTLSGRIYDDAKGVLGLGDRVDLIAFDPKRRVPRALLARSQSIDKDGLPLPSAFQLDLQRTLSGMGLPEIGSQATLPILISFVYELFLNTVQHGLPEDSRLLSHSTRGISLAKIAYGKGQLSARHLSVSLKEFLLRVAEMQKREANLLVVCISVMDMGGGIQNTLPSVSMGESEPERLRRAFEVGQTRKATTSVERGVGLNKVVEAAFRLGARLQVVSAGRVLVKDFSLGEDRFPTMEGASEQQLPSHFRFGTSVDMYIPNLLVNVDQRKLIL